ncbi:MAG TPA: phosphoglucosamine mutase [Candidatus Paceibacterota bacterium]|nr:phosphoglucosamine mutase [Candidatus Paceibacterota bacterium]
MQKQKPKKNVFRRQFGRFGTDGIRGVANTEVTAELAMQVGKAAGAVFMKNNGAHRHRVIIGKDTRESGYMIENAITSGFLAVGVDVLLTGPLPTPAIAMLTVSMGCDIGVMISASHNPYADNGIKIFGSDGHKLPDSVEAEIEQLVNSDLSEYAAQAGKLGRAERIHEVQGRYVEFAKRTLPRNTNFENLKVVIDCANGAAHKVAPWVLRELRADAIPIGIEPNGVNINQKVGSTYPSTVAARVLTEAADVGIALDGDADRVIIVDEKGQVVDGDQIIAAIATAMHEGKRLRGGVAVTVMSNLGLEHYLRDRDIKVTYTKVGDRHVNEAMQSLGYNLGGEQSGHIICSDYSTTGDGLIAGLQALSILKKSGRPASEVFHCFDPIPQDLRNVLYREGTKPLEHLAVKRVIAKSERLLLGRGRLVVRESGTESVIRIMAQGENRAEIEEVVRSIAHAIEMTS